MADIINLIQQGKIKRYFRARQKLDYPGLVSHITQRSTGKEPLFIEDNDYLYMMKLLKDLKSKFNLQIFAFCLMSNHVHILLRQNMGNLSRAMHDLFTVYAMYFNNKYKRKGHLFGGRFRQAACFEDHYLLTASLYIHLNPVRAGIADHYSQYKWSTWRLYCQDIYPDTFIDWKFILQLLDKDISTARKRYKNLLAKSLNYKAKEVMEVKKAIGQFQIWLVKNFPDLLKMRKKRDSGKLMIEGYAEDRELEDIINSLKNKKRLNKISDIKAREFAIAQLKSRGFSAREIADILDISHVTVYKTLSQK